MAMLIAFSTAPRHINRFSFNHNSGCTLTKLSDFIDEYGVVHKRFVLHFRNWEHYWHMHELASGLKTKHISWDKNDKNAHNIEYAKEIGKLVDLTFGGFSEDDFGYGEQFFQGLNTGGDIVYFGINGCNTAFLMDDAIATRLHGTTVETH